MSPKAKLQHISETARARFLSYVMILALFGLIFSGDIVNRVLAVTDSSNILANVEAGVLTIDQVPNNVSFNAGKPGENIVANIGNADAGGTRRLKLTSTLSATFTLSGYFNTNFYSGAAPTTQMAIASRMQWHPTTNGVVQNLTTDSEGANVSEGADANFAGIASGNKLTMASGASSSKGKFALSNLTFNYQIPITASAASDYVTTLITELI